MSQPQDAALPATVSASATVSQPASVETADPLPGVPGYELFEILGRGGMGVVYKARHVALNRLVALKMIRSGDLADERERARFRAEAEAAARLQHPGIVAVFEVGEHQGHLFCALEHVSGGSLAQRLKAGPLAAREAARLVEALARAVHLAHARNVVHRDLKPANVLLAEDGTPKVADFGLARLTDSDSGATQAGAVMGTPSYMAPEQASGRAHEAGPAADVYALGAILYECLAGRPPFRGATVPETLDQVRTQDPVPPSRLRTGVPLDLEVVCLKCLAKEPERRYASAAELAEELARFLRGEPIQARPAGRLERAAKWVRRNPAVAALAAAVLLVLVAGITATSVLAWVAGEAAEKARQGEAAAVAARDDLAAANVKLEESADNLASNVARGLLRPLGVQVDPARPLPPLGEPEIDSLWALATEKEERVRDRFVALALPEPVMLRQLKDRAAFALQAAVGLDGARRARAEALLGGRLRAPGTPAAERVHLAVCLAHLGGRDRALAGEVVAALTQALDRTVDRGEVEGLGQALVVVAGRVEPGAGLAAVVAAPSWTRPPFTTGPAHQYLAEALQTTAGRLEPAEAAAALTRALAQAKGLAEGFPLRAAVARALSAATARLEPKEAAAALAAALARTTDQQALRSLERDLSAVVARLRPAEAVALSQAMGGDADWGYEHLLVPALEAAGPPEPAEAAALADLLAGAMGRAADPTGRFTAARRIARLAPALAALAGRLGTTEAARVCGRGAAAVLPGGGQGGEFSDDLAKALAALAPRLGPQDAAAAFKRAVGLARPGLGWGEAFAALKALAARLGPEDTAAAAAHLTRTLCQQADEGRAHGTVLAHVLAALAARLDAAEAARLCGQAAAGLAEAIDRAKDEQAVHLSQYLTPLAPYLGPEEADAAIAALIRAVTRAADDARLGIDRQAWVAVAARLRPKAAAAAFRPLSQALAQATAPNRRRVLLHTLAVLGPRLEGEEAAEAAAALLQAVQAVSQTQGPAPFQSLELVRSLGEGLAALGPRLERQAAADTAAALLRALNQAQDPNMREALLLNALTPLLAAVPGRLRPKEAAEAAELLLGHVATRPLGGGLSGREPLQPWPSIVQALEAAGASMDPRQSATRLLAGAMGRKGDVARLGPLAHYLAAASRLEPDEAARAFGGAAAGLSEALGRPQPDSVPGVLVQGLAELAPYLGPKEAAAAAAALVEGLDRAADPFVVQYFGRALAAVAPCLGPKEASAANAALVRALNRTATIYAVRDLSLALAAAAKRDPEGAPAAAAALVESLRKAAQGKPTPSDDPARLIRLLAEVGAYLPPAQAAGTAGLLERAMGSTTDPVVLAWLAHGLAVVAPRMEPEAGARTCARAAAALTAAVAPTTHPGSRHLVPGALAALAGTMKSEEAAAALAGALAQFGDRDSVKALTSALAAAASRLGPRDAVAAVAVLTRALATKTEPDQVIALAVGLRALALRLDPAGAAAVVPALIRALSRTGDVVASRFLAEALAAALSRDWVPDRLRAAATAPALGPTAAPFAALPLLRPALEPPPPPMPPQALIELLKHPLCVGAARRAVLDQLGRQYGRTFADQWDFVEYAHKKNLGLDLLGPPRLENSPP